MGNDIPGTAVAVWYPATRSIGDLALDTASVWPWHAQSLREARATRLEARAFAVIVAMPGERGVRLEAKVVFADVAPASLVFGAHPACDFAELRGACLRHAMVLGWADGAIDLIDLNTSVGVAVADRRSAGCAARGALRFTVGEAHVFVVAAAPGEELRLSWGEIDRRLAVARAGWSERGQRRTPPAIDAMRASLATSFEHTVVFRGPGRVGGSGAEARQRITVRSSVAELERGLVIGRYDRCEVRGPLADDVGVSRVHAVVLLRDDRLWVIDAASTNGTQIRSVVGGALDADLFADERVRELRAGEAIEIRGHRVEIQV